jgi:BASS family bile acid:Na+ symporter
MFRKVIESYTRGFVLWVMLLGVAAYFWPEAFRAINAFHLAKLLPSACAGGLAAKALAYLTANRLFFAMTLFGIGMALQPADFKEIAKRPGLVVVGTAAQYLIMPLAAWLLGRAFHLPPALAIGLILTAATPEAMSTSVMSYVAKADTAYAVSLTTVSTLICPIVTPGLTKLLAGSSLSIDFWSMLLDVIVMVVVPLWVGFLVRGWLGSRLDAILPVFPALSVTLIAFICALVIALNRETLSKVTGVVLTVDLLLNLIGLAGGYGAAVLFRMTRPQRRTLALEVGMQNAALGAALAVQHIGAEAAIPAAIFVFVCIVTAALLTAIWQRMEPSEA